MSDVWAADEGRGVQPAQPLRTRRPSRARRRVDGDLVVAVVVAFVVGAVAGLGAASWKLGNVEPAAGVAVPVACVKAAKHARSAYRLGGDTQRDESQEVKKSVEKCLEKAE